jgi:hypothetical protein
MIRHNGTAPGWLHAVDETPLPEDIYPHPQTTLGPGLEWLTRRDLRLRLIGAVPLSPEEQWSEVEVRRVATEPDAPLDLPR